MSYVFYGFLVQTARYGGAKETPGILSICSPLFVSLSKSMSDAAIENQPCDSGPEQPEAAAGSVCAQCEHPVPDANASVCPHCGWYALAGVFVDIAPEWEAASSGAETQAAPPSHLEVWSKLVPAWVWIALAAFASVFAESFAVKLLITEESTLARWSIGQLFGGIGVIFGCHLLVYVMMSVEDATLGVADIIVSPFKSWRLLFSRLPRHQWLIHGLLMGVAAILGSTLILGQIPYEKIWDWGITPPAKKELLKAIASSAPGSPEMTMEEAMESFAADAAVGGAGGGNGPKAKPQRSGPIARKKMDTLILGYTLDRNHLIASVLIAAEANGTLLYAGRVTPLLTPDESHDLVRKFQSARSPRPVVSAPDGAQWVQPRFTCRVTYEKRVESGRLQGLLWEEMLGEVKLPW